MHVAPIEDDLRLFILERALGLIVLALCAWTIFKDPLSLELVRLQGFNLLQTHESRATPPPDEQPVTIVAIDEASLAAVGQWPWPRTVMARLVDRLSDAGASAIGLDAVFAEPDRTSPDRIVRSVPGLPAEVRGALEGLDDHDAVFARSISRSRVVLGQAGSWDAPESADRPPLAGVVKPDDPDVQRFLPHFPSLVRNIPELETAAAGHGMFSFFIRPDGVARWLPTLFVHDGVTYPGLFVEMLRVAKGRPEILVEGRGEGVDTIRIADDLTLHPDRWGRVQIWYSLSDPGRYVSAADVLSGSVAAERIAGKLVLVGATAAGLLDLNVAPNGESIPGVEIHAQAIECTLAGTCLTRPRHALTIEVVVVVVLGLAMIVALPLWHAVAVLPAVLALEAALAAFAWGLMRTTGVLFDAANPGWVLAAVYLALTWGRMIARERARPA